MTNPLNTLPIAAIDAHWHLDLFPDHEACIARAEAASIFTLAVTTTPKAWVRNYQLTKQSRYVHAALGLHPQLVGERSNELSLWQTYLSDTRFIGEVGLDANPKFYNTLELQKQIFKIILQQCAIIGDKILSIHSTRSVPMVLDMIEYYLTPARGKIILHWYTGTLKDVQRALDLGCYFSVNNQMGNTTHGRRMLSILPLDRLLTETDGPFTKFGNSPAKPQDAHSVNDWLARLRGISPVSLQEQLVVNLRALIEQ